MKWAKTDSWGSWHPAAQMCVQPECRMRWHTIDEAARLNAQAQEYKRAVLYESMRRWRES